MSAQCHCHTFFMNKIIGKTIIHGRNIFSCDVMQTKGGSFEVFQVIKQLLHEPHDLNMDFCSFKNDFKQLVCIGIYLKIYCFHINLFFLKFIYAAITI